MRPARPRCCEQCSRSRAKGQLLEQPSSQPSIRHAVAKHMRHERHVLHGDQRCQKLRGSAGQKQRPFTPLSSWVALCTCWGVAHGVRDRAWRLCFKSSLLLAAASRQTAGPYGLSCPSTLGGWAGQKSGAGRSGPTRAGCEHSAPCLLSRRAVVSPREDSWRLPHETEEQHAIYSHEITHL